MRDDKLDPFLQERADYIAIAQQHAAICLQWQASDVGTENGGDGYPISERGDEYTDQIAGLLCEQVTAFVEDNWQTLGEANVPPEQCGHDLILTANGHGAGFWDRGLGEAGDKLTEAAKAEGSFEAEFALWGDQADGDEHCSDELAWLMVENEIIFHDDGYETDPKRCSTCQGILSPTTMGGYVHLHDSDDTHTPTEE